jgi:urea transport system substrate-binding protein
MKRYATLLSLLLSSATALGLWYLYTNQRPFQEPIRIGILHSFTGTMTLSERPVADAMKLAVEEINAAGGLHGRPLAAIEADGRSDWPTFAREAERLITQEQVAALFGCWNSGCRKRVKAVVERHNHLLFYPVQYEGLEQSPNIIYLGAAPNQQIIPAVKWALDNLGQRLFLVGSDSIFPHTANAIIRDLSSALGGEIVGEHYLPLGGHQVDKLVEEISKIRPNVILNTITGDSNISFFRALRRAGISTEQIPTLSFSIDENMLEFIGLPQVAGDYAAWNYFESIENGANQAFIERFRKRYGAGRRITDPMEAGYLAVQLWAAAVREARTANVEVVRSMILNQAFDAPSGMVYVDPISRHLWKTPRIGRINSEGDFDIVWSAGRPSQPNPYPLSRNRAEWNRFLDQLQRRWQGNWQAPKATTP